MIYGRLNNKLFSVRKKSCYSCGSQNGFLKKITRQGLNPQYVCAVCRHTKYRSQVSLLQKAMSRQ